MTECAPKWRLFLYLFLGFSLASCTQIRRSSSEDEKEPQFIEGKKRENRMDYDGAIQSFERALQANPSNAAAHFELGVLDDQKKNDYAAAIYHYQRHLTLRTNSPMGELVKQRITDCTRELAKSVQYAVVTRDVQRDLERLSQTNSLLKARVEYLENELGRRPQYITNVITNFVAVPQGDQRGASRLTQPTQSVPAPQTVENNSREAIASERVELSHNGGKGSPPKATPLISTRHPTAAAERRPIEPTTVAATTGGTREVHTIRPGETLAALANKYGVNLAALKAANPGSATGVHAGQKINIPR